MDFSKTNVKVINLINKLKIKNILFSVKKQ